MRSEDAARDAVLRFHANRDQTALNVLLQERDATQRLLSALPQTFRPAEMGDLAVQQTWEQLAGIIGQTRGAHDSLALFQTLYEHMMRYEAVTRVRLHKGMPLVWISECHAKLQRPALAKRFLMLTLIEDAIQDKGIVDRNRGVYFRAVWQYGMSAPDVQRYGEQAASVASTQPEAARFPEWVLQQLDDQWLLEYPSAHEGYVYFANTLYIQWLLEHCGDGSGEMLETLARYVVSVMPGCRARKERSHSTDYDIMGCIEGPQHDFRSELGRYFVCECKDWSKPANFAAFAKFCRILDSVKCRFGILFSRQGVTGTARTTDAAREQVKVFQDRGMVIVVVSLPDLQALASGSNLVALLRAKYEAVRMDLRVSDSPRTAPH